jgi:hypothetical protein
MMHTVEDEDNGSEEEEEQTYEARCEEDLDELSVDELQLMVRMLSNPVKKTTKATTPGNRSAARKGKAAERPAPSAAPAPSAPVPQPSASTNPAPASKAVAPKSSVPQTIVPHIRYPDPRVKGKDAVGPDFHFQCPIEDKADAKKVLDRILDITVPVTAREILSLSPEVRKQAKESTTTKKIKAAAFVSVEPVSNYLHALEASDCHEGLVVAKESHALRSIVPIVDGNQAIECVLDSGCQIVGMSRAVWMALSKEYNPAHTVSMQSANGTVDRSLGIIENLSFRVGTIEIQLQVHVIEEPAYDILLGRPFDVLTESIIRNSRNEDQTITITDPNNPHHVATLQTQPRGPPRFRSVKKREGF